MDTDNKPADLGLLADLYWEIREQRLALDKQSAELKQREDDLKTTITIGLQTYKLTAIGGQKVRLTLVRKEEPSCADWQSFYSYVKETGEFDLLYRRINPAAVKLRLADGQQVPGIEWIPVFQLSKSKV